MKLRKKKFEVLQGEEMKKKENCFTSCTGSKDNYSIEKLSYDAMIDGSGVN